MSQTILIGRCLLILFLFASPAVAASISIIPTMSPTSFSLQGTDMDDIAGIQLDIAYDEASLAAPTVTQGELVTGAILVANTSRPGIIKIAIISTRAFSGSGRIATVSFAEKKGNGNIVLLSSNMINSSGTPFPSSAGSRSGAPPAAVTASHTGTAFEPPVQQTASPAQQQNSSTTAVTNPVSNSTPTYPGIITLPAEQQQTDSHPAPSSTVPVYAGESPAGSIAEQSPPAEKTPADARARETPQRIVYMGILERFKQYSGSKNFSAMTALFNKKAGQSAQQKPALVSSNGQNKVVLTIDLPVRIDSSPDVAVSGGKLISLKKDNERKHRWIITVLPDTGSVKVTVTVMAGADEFEFPLAVVPPVKTALSLNESGWNRFIREVGTTGVPMHDLNNDGVRDYMDEFIFVANHFLNKAAPPKPAAVSKPEKK